MLHHDITGHVMNFIWGIERKTTVSLNNFYYTFIFDWFVFTLYAWSEPGREKAKVEELFIAQREAC